MPVTGIDLQPGQRLPAFELPATDGSTVRSVFYRNRRNLVIVAFEYPACAPCRGLLADLATHYGDVQADDGQVLAIACGARADAERLAREDRLPFPVLVDERGDVRRALGQELLPWAVYVADRDATIYAAYRAGDGRSLPAVAELLEWLSYIALQCPE